MFGFVYVIAMTKLAKLLAQRKANKLVIEKLFVDVDKLKALKEYDIDTKIKLGSLKDVLKTP